MMKRVPKFNSYIQLLNSNHVVTYWLINHKALKIQVEDFS